MQRGGSLAAPVLVVGLGAAVVVLGDQAKPWSEQAQVGIHDTAHCAAIVEGVGLARDQFYFDEVTFFGAIERSRGSGSRRRRCRDFTERFQCPDRLLDIPMKIFPIS